MRKESRGVRRATRTILSTNQMSKVLTPLWITVHAALIIYLHTSAHAAYNFNSSDNGREPDMNRRFPEHSWYFASLKRRLILSCDDFDIFSPMDLAFFGVIILMALELLSVLVKNGGRLAGSALIPVRAQHLDDLDSKDLLFIGLNKAATPPFVYILIRYLYFESNAVWDLKEASLVSKFKYAWNYQMLFEVKYKHYLTSLHTNPYLQNL
uniref:Uncharacterized protein n=1 Tax=Proboscia inermis TaxID=420281 RepID=A0A7S0C4X0_9STRA|mmetsp:Transcript_27181/g.27571  ORF Transcript_27181/g.27571 Transcript_27181/m.27571 type:complete len:210 (+) Transcript_27181:50-679(+)